MKNHGRIHNKSGQATTELAIFGSLFLVMLGVMLSLGQNINHQIDTQVDAYVKALQSAQVSADGPVSYTIIRDKRLGNTSGTYKDLSRASFSSGATVLWGKFLNEPDIEPHSYYQINDDDPIDMRQDAWKKDFDGKDDDGDGETDEDDEYSYPQVWDIPTTTATNYSGKENTATDTDQITTTKEATLREDITRTLKLRYYNREEGIDEEFQDYVVTQSAYPRDDNTLGYKTGGTGVKWQRTITTPK